MRIISLSSTNIGSVPKRSKFIDFKKLPLNGSIIFKGLNLRIKSLESSTLITNNRIAKKLFDYILNIESCHSGSIFISGSDFITSYGFDFILSSLN